MFLSGQLDATWKAVIFTEIDNANRAKKNEPQIEFVDISQTVTRMAHSTSDSCAFWRTLIGKLKFKFRLKWCFLFFVFCTRPKCLIFLIVDMLTRASWHLTLFSPSNATAATGCAHNFAECKTVVGQARTLALGPLSFQLLVEMFETWPPLFC